MFTQHGFGADGERGGDPLTTNREAEDSKRGWEDGNEGTVFLRAFCFENARFLNYISRAPRARSSRSVKIVIGLHWKYINGVARLETNAAHVSIPSGRASNKNSQEIAKAKGADARSTVSPR